MTTARPMGHRVRIQPGIASLLDRWFRLRPIERHGRIYASFGLVPVFARMARLFGERLPRPDRLASSSLDQVRMRARYHELINLMSIVVQLPLVYLAWSAGSAALTAYAVALMAPHVLSVMLERYKRALCEVEPSSWDDAPLAAEASVQETTRQDRCNAHVYFGPFRGETERLYEMLGVEAFRRFVLMLIRISSPLDTDGASLRNVVGGRTGLATFAAQTRTAELTHLFGTLLHAPFAVAFARSGHISGLVFVIFLFGLNIICALLQRQHRVRLAGLMRRAQRRPMRSARNV